MAETQAAQAQKKSGNRHKKWPRRAKGGEGKACGVKDCKRPYRAKGYCYFHYKKWRQGELPHSRYRVCSKAECRSKAVKHGLCEKHFNEAYKKGEAPAAAAPAAAPA
ncbi:MAG TPA: vegetative protein [Myxococcales bacterium]|nr:vegetative protein [Myxococcales bacterium]